MRATVRPSRLDASNSAQGAPEVQLSFMGVASDVVTQGILSKAAERVGLCGEDVVVGTVEDACHALSRSETPEVLVVDLSLADNVMVAVEGLADVCAPGTRLICLGTQNDVRLYRQLIGCGVSDYLVKPVSTDVMQDALRRTVRDFAEAETGEASKNDETIKGQIIGVTGARGGAGASLVATNLAVALAVDPGRKVALVDLDLQFGSAALMLDVEPGRGFLDALQQPDRLDSLFIERSMVRLGPNFAVLAAEEDLSVAPVIPDGSLQVLFDILTDTFDFVVLDVPRGALREVTGLLHSLYLVTDPTLLGVRDTLRLKRLVKGTASAEKSRLPVRVILNEGVTSGELTGQRLSKIDDLNPDVRLPSDTKTAGDAAAQGKALVSLKPRAKLSRVFTDLAVSIDPPSGPPKTSLLSRLISNRKRSPAMEGA